MREEDERTKSPSHLIDPQITKQYLGIIPMLVPQFASLALLMVWRLESWSSYSCPSVLFGMESSGAGLVLKLETIGDHFIFGSQVLEKLRRNFSHGKSVK